MSRHARLASDSGIYHIMLRGINHQQIFFDEEDIEVFLMVIKDCLAVSDFKVYAWCLMGNHVHLLIRENSEPISLVMKRICVRYVLRYNTKYGRSGHLFQDRYKSEPVDTDTYYRTVFRYILQNPVKAGIVSAPGGYRWSSFNACFGNPDGITSPDGTVLLGLDSSTLREFLCKTNDDEAMDDSDNRRKTINDKAAVDVLLKESGISDIYDFCSLPKIIRDNALRAALEAGATVRQIARLTGLSKSTVAGADRY